MDVKQELADSLAAASGSKVWKPVRTHGSMFFLEIGEPFSRSGDTREHGEWSLLVEEASWRFLKGAAVILSFDDTTSTIDSVFKSLELGNLTGHFIDITNRKIEISTSSGVELVVDRDGLTEDDYSDLWVLYTKEPECTWVSNVNGITRSTSG